MMLSTTIPDIEIHLSNDPIALVISAGYIKPYKITNKGNYFSINEKRTRGIYTIKGPGLMWGKTKVYFYHVEETNPIDPVLSSELNHYMKTNELTKITLADVKHGSRLRILSKIVDKENPNPLDKVQTEENVKLTNLDSKITEGVTKISKMEDDIKEKYEKDISIPPVKKSYMLLDHLLETKQIDDKEYYNFLHKIENHELDFNRLVNYLRDAHVIRVYEPLDVNVETYINELGAQNARELAGFVQDLRNNKKGLADMTSKPATSFLTGGVVLAIGIVALLAIVLIPQSLPNATGGHGGINLNPFTMFGGPPKFLLSLLNHLPSWLF